MNRTKDASSNLIERWQQFVTQEQLSPLQAAQFKQYMQLLSEWNTVINLTAITQEEAIIEDHFQDSLFLSHTYDLMSVQTIGDIGTGAGFPGIPLKIRYPHLAVILIEVNQKKVTFLQKVIAMLKLERVEIYTNDWRTFLRNTHYPIDLFVARASLKPEELVRLLMPSCGYKKATLVYWASKGWVPQGQTIASLIDHEVVYGIGEKERRLIFFKTP